MKEKATLLFVVCTMALLVACSNKETPTNSAPSASPSSLASKDTIVKKLVDDLNEQMGGELPLDEGDDEDGKLHLNLEVSGGTVDADPEDPNGFLGAVTFNEKDRVLEYIEAGVNIDFLDENGFGAIYNALQNNNVEIAKLLLDNGANINIQNADKYTPLLAFTEYNSVDMVRFLLENGADPNIGGGDNDDYYPIIAATLFNYAEIAKLLLDDDAYPNLVYLYDGESVNATQIAERYGFTEIAQLIKNSLKQ